MRMTLQVFDKLELPIIATRSNPHRSKEMEVSINQQIQEVFKEVKPERDYVTSNPSLPDPSSSLYLTISKQKNADKSESHLISGMQVIFNPANDENNLFTSYHIDPEKNKLPDNPSPEGTIRSLTICADELVIYGELCLPQTDLTVFARKLTFRAQGGKPGRIITSPLPYANKQAGQEASGKGIDGLNGKKAGGITIYASHLETDDPLANRFCLRGSKGQEPGTGKDGTAGASVTALWTQFTWKANFVFGSDSLTYWFDPPASSIHRIDKAGFSWGATEHDDWYGTNLAPTDGTDALSAGKPGAGGDGGAFTGVFSAQVFEALTFATDQQVIEAAVQKAQSAQPFLQTALTHAAALEKLGANFNTESFQSEMKLTKDTCAWRRKRCSAPRKRWRRKRTPWRSYLPNPRTACKERCRRSVTSPPGASRMTSALSSSGAPPSKSERISN
jgi:hypothetical protein